MREIRQSGSEGGGASLRSPYPYRESQLRAQRSRTSIHGGSTSIQLFFNRHPLGIE